MLVVFLLCLLGISGLPENAIKIVPNEAKELTLKQFRIYHLLISKEELKADSFYRLVISFHGAVSLIIIIRTV